MSNKESIPENIKENFPLAPLTTFKIGGSARYFLEESALDSLRSSFDWAKSSRLKFTIIGGGSNLLVSDNGYDGLIIKLANDAISISGEVIDCGAGALLANAVNQASIKGISGLEWAVGIPGTIGGAVRGNAGAFGGCMADSVAEVEALELPDAGIAEFSNDRCGFGYRNSIFKKSGNLIIWSIRLKLLESSPDKIKQRMDEFLRRRSKIQPGYPSAGSIFKNLLIDELKDFNSGLAEKAQDEKAVKGGMVGAGWVIDQLGLKGKAIGGAMVSHQHANFIVNAGNAKADEVMMLISYVKQQVRDKLGVQLHEEIAYIGFD